jgi:hypothetical protein
MENDLLKLRRMMLDKITNVNSIDKLMADKVNPYVVMDELPCPVQLGGKIMYVGNLNLANEDYFFKKWASILGNLNLQHMFMSLLSDGMELMKYMKIHSKLRKELTKLVGKTLLKQQKWYYERTGKMYKLNKFSMRYFKNHCTKEKLIQIVFLLWTYNYDAQGKSIALVLNKMGAGAMSETYMYSWLVNLDGATGKFLLSQLPDLEWFNNEYLKSDEEKQRIEEDS